MKRVRMSMHGFGYIGRIHVGSLALTSTVPGAKTPIVWQTACVRDVNAPTAADAGQFFETVTNDWSEAVTSADAVDIVSPNDVHGTAVATAIAHGRPVYCEKPLAHDIGQARDMAALVDRAGVTNQVALIYRFHPAVEGAYRILQSGVMGRVLTFRAVLLHGSYLDPMRPISWRLRLQNAGAGALMDLGVHLFDVVHMLMGPTKSVQATLRTFVETRCSAAGSSARTERVDVDDWALVQLQMSSGATGSVEVSRVHYGLEDACCDIVCEKGTIHLPLHQQQPATVHGLGGSEATVPASGSQFAHALQSDRATGINEIEPYRLPAKYASDPLLIGHAVGLQTFLLRVGGGSLNYPVPTFREALAAEEVVEAAKWSAAHDEAVHIPTL